MPLILESEAEDKNRDEEKHGCWVGYNKACFGIDVSVVPFGVETSECVVHPVPDEPADKRSDDTEEVEEA